MILRFENFNSMNEMVKNRESAQRMADDICQRAKKLISCETKTEMGDNLVISIYGMKRSDIGIIENMLSDYQSIAIKQDMILSFGESKAAVKFEGTKMVAYLKSIYSIRVKPQRYVYHFSTEDKESIMKNGLQPRKSDSSKQWTNPALSYPPAVFAINDYSTHWGVGNIFEIDTQGLNNKWWRDLNFATGPAIMTFEAIPADHIRLVSEKERGDREKERKAHLADLEASAVAEEQILFKSIESGDMESIRSNQPPSIDSKASRLVAKYGDREMLDWFFSKKRSDREIQAIAGFAAASGNDLVGKYLDEKFPGVVDKERVEKWVSYSKK
jgi:hypothetical protein